jgi:hypothetical protein
MTSGRATPLTNFALVVTQPCPQVCTQGCRARAPVTASGPDQRAERIDAGNLTRSAVPCAITQAEPSF